MYKRILVVVDDRVVTQSAIRQAIELAQVHGSDIHFLYILPRYTFDSFEPLAVAENSFEDFQKSSKNHAQQMLAAAVEIAERFGVFSMTSMGNDSDDAKFVSDAALHKHCDLIVIGTEGRNAVMRLLTGSIVPGLISHATVPVLVCRDTGSHGGFGRRSTVSMRARKRRLELLERRKNEKSD